MDIGSSITRIPRFAMFRNGHHNFLTSGIMDLSCRYSLEGCGLFGIDRVEIR